MFRMPRWAPYLWKRFRSKWVEAVIGAAVATALAMATFFGGKAKMALEKLWGSIRNISETEALEEARALMGPSVTQAIPFRNRGGEQFVLVVSRDTESVLCPEFLLNVLEGSSGAFRVTEPSFSACDKLGDEQTFGVVDVDNDGINEIFAIERDGGTGVYGFHVLLYNPQQGDTLSADGGGPYSEPPTFSWSENTRSNPKAQKWLTSKARELVFGTFAADQHDSLTRLEADWIRRNGVGFVEGSLRSRPEPGPLPSPDGSTVCRFDDGEYEWTSLFKSGVFGYRRTTNEHFAVFFPRIDYDWIQLMASGKRFLWMRYGSGIVALDKERMALHSVDAALVVKKGRVVLDMPVVIGDDVIEPEREFANASSCDDSSFMERQPWAIAAGRADSALGEVAADWVHTNGSEFVEGMLRSHAFAGPIPKSDFESCKLSDDQYDWSSVFQVGVFGYRRSSNEHFAVFVPAKNGDIPSMVAGERFLWMEYADSILVFDKKRASLGFASYTLRTTNYDEPGLALKGGKLFFNGMLVVTRKPEELEQEFIRGVACHEYQ